MILLFFSSVSHAHKGKPHSAKASEAPVGSKASMKKEMSSDSKVASVKKLRKINELYLKEVKPVFIIKCFESYSK